MNVEQSNQLVSTLDNHGEVAEKEKGCGGDGDQKYKQLKEDYSILYNEYQQLLQKVSKPNSSFSLESQETEQPIEESEKEKEKQKKIFLTSLFSVSEGGDGRKIFYDAMIETAIESQKINEENQQLRSELTELSKKYEIMKNNNEQYMKYKNAFEILQKEYKTLKTKEQQYKTSFMKRTKEKEILVKEKETFVKENETLVKENDTLEKEKEEIAKEKKKLQLALKENSGIEEKLIEEKKQLQNALIQNDREASLFKFMKLLQSNSKMIDQLHNLPQEELSPKLQKLISDLKSLKSVDEKGVDDDHDDDTDIEEQSQETEQPFQETVQNKRNLSNDEDEDHIVITKKQKQN